MFAAIEIFKKKKNKEKIFLKEGEKIIANENIITEKIAEYYKELFNKKVTNDLNNIKPTEMTIPFTECEISQAIKRLKNGKSPGSDNIAAEQLKYGPKVINKYIAQILNEIAIACLVF